VKLRRPDCQVSLTATSLDVLPDKPVLLAYALVLSQVFGQLMLGLAPLLKQYFLPVAMTFSLLLGSPTSSGSMPSDLLASGYVTPSHVFPLAQGVKITRSLAYFNSADVVAPTLILLGWAVLMVGVASIAWTRQSRQSKAKEAGATVSEPVGQLQKAGMGRIRNPEIGPE
jgi:hypothetical protein